jgi:murein DD-endopeptidase MepM/ murein hydrolase activator NlpD
MAIKDKIDQDFANSLIKKVMFGTGKKKQQIAAGNDNIIVSQDNIVKMSDSLTSLQNAFNTIYAHSLNIRNLQQFQEKRLQTIKKESNIESKLSSGSMAGGAMPSGESGLGLSAAKLDKLAEKMGDLNDKLDKLDLSSGGLGAEELGTAGGLGLGASKIGRKLAGPIGALIDTGMRASEGQSVGQIASGVGGGLAGGYAGAALGTAIFPGVGTAIGGIGGYLLGGMAGDAAYNSIQGRANGGIVKAGGTYVVGERGPELITFNGMSGRVRPNGQTGGSSTAEKYIMNAAAQSSRARAKFEQERTLGPTSYSSKFSNYLSSLFTSIPDWVSNIKKFFNPTMVPPGAFTDGPATIESVMAMQLELESSGGKNLRTTMDNAGTMGGGYGMGNPAREDAYKNMTREERAQFEQLTGFKKAPTLNELVSRDGKSFLSDKAKIADEMLARSLARLTITSLRKSLGREPSMVDVRGSMWLGPAGYAGYLQDVAANPSMTFDQFYNKHSNWPRPDMSQFPKTLGEFQATLLQQVSRFSGGTPSAAGFYSPTRKPIATSSGFGGRMHPILGKWQNHGGLDIPAKTGDPIYAVKAGTVANAYNSTTYGNVVFVDHGGGIETRYAHLSEINVVAGQGVDQNTVLGLAGSTGRSTGPHLHFEVRINGRPVDPTPYLQAAAPTPPAPPATPVAPTLPLGYQLVSLQDTKKKQTMSFVRTPAGNMIPLSAKNTSQVPGFTMLNQKAQNDIIAYFRIIK